MTQKGHNKVKPSDLKQAATLTALVAPIEGIFEVLVLSFLQMTYNLPSNFFLFFFSFLQVYPAPAAVVAVFGLLLELS